MTIFRVHALEINRTIPLTQTIALMSQSIYCKFLFSREQFLFHHICLPDSPDRIAAIVHEGKCYSLFRTVQSAQDSLNLVIKASHKGNEMALTQAGQRYLLWVHEADAIFSSSQNEEFFQPSHNKLDTFSAAPCRIFTQISIEQFKVKTQADTTQVITGFQVQDQNYRLIQKEQNAAQTVASIAERACRGQEVAIVPLKNDYGIFVLDF